jgi:glutamyl-tRNA reductase
MAGGSIFTVGVSWRTAPIDLRERLVYPDEDIPEKLAELAGLPNIDECMILSTCNRIEIYGAVSRGNIISAVAEARAFLSHSRRVSVDEIAGKVYEHIGIDAVEHAFRVASALDSMVLGESQILGQVKDSYGLAVRANTSGPLLSRCMERAFLVAKRVRTETGISKGAANVSTVAVELARRVFGKLEGKDVLVVGAGKMSGLAARHLRASGATQVYVTNRSSERAQELAREVDGQERPWAALSELLTLADVIISSTGAREPIISRALMKDVMKARRHRPLVIVDTAVPRDVEPTVASLDGVYLFDIDDLERVVAENLKERQREADSARELVSGEVKGFEDWLRSQRVVPTIRSLREHFHEIASAEVEKIVQQISDENDPVARAAIVRRLSTLIVNKLLHTPMTALKTGQDPDLDKLVEVTQRLFDLDKKKKESAS